MPQPTDDEIRRRYGLPPGTRIVRLTPDALGRVRVDPDAFAYVVTRPTLEWGAWDRPVVVAGATVRLTVQATFTGEDNPVRVTLRDGRNRVVGRGEGRMFRDRAVVDVAVDRRAAEREPGGALCAADVELTELGLKVVSAPLTVLPYAALDRARWGQPEARDGDAVALSCRLTGSAAGVERLEGRTAEVEVLRGGEGGAGDGAAAALFEPVVALRVPVADGRVEATWRVGYDADGKARIATQAELDAAAARPGGAAGAYRRPAWRFRVRLAGLAAESPEMGYRDHVDLAWGAGTDRPAGGAAVEVRLADGTVREETLGADGRLRLADVPPGPVEAVFGPDPRVWEPPPDFRRPAVPEPEPLPSSDALALEFGRTPPPEPVLVASSGELDPALLADLAGLGTGSDDESWIEWLWGTVKGDFNEDASYDQIVANIGVSFVPVVGQIMDVRDIFAGLYLLTKDRGWTDGLKWLALFVTLVGIIPVLGDALKGVFRIALRSIKNGADDVAGAAAQAVEAAFAKAKRIMQEADVDYLDGVESAAQWVRDLDVGWLVDWAKHGVDLVGKRTVELFEWFAKTVEGGLFRFGMWLVEPLVRAWSGVKMLAGQAFRLDVERLPSGAPVNPARLAAALRGIAREVEEVQASANAQVGEGLNRLYDKLREIVGVPPRSRGAGVSGGVVEPDGAGPRGPGRVADDVIAARRKLAEDFYVDQGFARGKDLQSHLDGIDYNHPVEVALIPAGTPVRQYQVRGSDWQGNYYFVGVEPPTRLGINPRGVVYGTATVDDKVVFEWVTVRETQALRSTAAPVVDPRSVPGENYQTLGGGVQYFTSQKGDFARSP